jgi:hypothetical protein
MQNEPRFARAISAVGSSDLAAFTIHLLNLFIKAFLFPERLKRSESNHQDMK